jgi:hypothetical protein
MTNFILIVVFMLPNGDYHVAHRINQDGSAVMYPTHAMCFSAAENIIKDGSKRLPFVTAECKEVPVPPMKEV